MLVKETIDPWIPDWIKKHPIIYSIAFVVLLLLGFYLVIFEPIWSQATDKLFFRDFLLAGDGFMLALKTLFVLAMLSVIYVALAGAVGSWYSRKRPIWIKVGGGKHLRGNQKFEAGDLVPNPTEEELRSFRDLLKTPKELGKEWTQMKSELDSKRQELSEQNQELLHARQEINELKQELESKKEKLATATAQLNTVTTTSEKESKAFEDERNYFAEFQRKHGLWRIRYIGQDRSDLNLGVSVQFIDSKDVDLAKRIRWFFGDKEHGSPWDASEIESIQWKENPGSKRIIVFSDDDRARGIVATFRDCDLIEEPMQRLRADMFPGNRDEMQDIAIIIFDRVRSEL